MTVPAPTVTAEGGYKHTGWSTELTDTFTQPETTITAEYKAKVVTTDPEDTDYVKVEFAAGLHGSITSGTTEYWVLTGETVSLEAPTATGNTWWSFSGWEPTVAVSYSIDTIHTAQYSYEGENVVPQEGATKPEVPDNFVKVTFAAGDHGDITTGETTYYVNPAKEVTIPAPTVEADTGYTHSGWTPGLTGVFGDGAIITAT